MKKLLLITGLLMALLLPMTSSVSAAEGTADPVISVRLPERMSFGHEILTEKKREILINLEKE